jgi:hypothetical protein
MLVVHVILQGRGLRSSLSRGFLSRFVDILRSLLKMDALGVEISDVGVNNCGLWST